MLRQIKGKLSPVRLRQRLDRTLRWGTLGLIAGAAFGSLGLALNWFDLGISAATAWIVFVIASCLASAIGLAWPTSWQSSARLIDAGGGLKDRTLTALDFASRENQDEMHALQLDDAIEHLSSIDAKQVLPWKTPKLAPVAIATLVGLLVLTFLPSSQATSVPIEPAVPLQVVLEQAMALEETMLEDLKELASELDENELEELTEEMQQAVEALKEPDVDQRDALAKLSEMQAALSAAMEQLNVQQTDAQLKQLAEALQVADATDAASQSLNEANYEKAATDLEKIDASTMSRKQREAIAAKLAKLSKKLGEGKQGELSESVQEMLEGLEDGDATQSKSGFCKAAGVCRKQGVRKKISDCLGCQLNRLAECKGCCQGQCNSSNPSSQARKSNSPSNNAGTAASGQPLGEESTKLDSQRREENVTGVAGEGPSERETLASAEANQDAARAYKDRYAEYRKQMEEVIDSEPLPLGHRETVRQYFENIRPTNADTE